MAAVALVSLLAQFAPVAPESPNAEGIRDSWLFVSIFVFAIFVLVEGLLIAFVWTYRRRARTGSRTAAQVHGATKLELAWTAGPVVVLFLIAAFVFIELPGIKDVPDAAAGEEQLEIKVVGPAVLLAVRVSERRDRDRPDAGARSACRSRLEVTAPDSDVIHSWWIPSLGGKIDAIPGTTNETWFQAENGARTRGSAPSSAASSTRGCSPRSRWCSQDEFDAWLVRTRRRPSPSSVARSGRASARSATA